MKKYTFGRTKYLLRIMLTSGNSFEFWVLSYRVSQSTMKWRDIEDYQRPLKLDYDTVESVVLVDTLHSVWPFYKSPQ